MSRPSSTALAADALRLRAWALRLLGGAPRDAPRVDPAAWTVFLRVEGCAIPVRNALRAAGADAAGGEAPLDDESTGESQRLLSARAQIASIDRLAAREGWCVAVLKGGVAVQTAQPLDVLDLDLLVEPAHAPPLLAALHTAGYAAYGVDHLVPGPRDHHYAPRWTPGSVPVEVHFRIGEMDPEHDLLGAAVPLAGSRALLRLAPADHLRHLLLHTVAHHPHRRGRLRDLLLIAAAVRELGDAGVAAARASLSASPFAAPLDETLGAARALAAGRTPEDVWRRVSGTVYAAAASGWVGRLPRQRQEELSTCISAVLGCPEDRRRLLSRVWTNPDKPSELPAVAWLEARSAVAGGVVRRSVRIARYAAAAAAALPLARAARVAERRAAS